MNNDRLFQFGFVAAIALGVVSAAKCGLDLWQRQPKPVQMIPAPVPTAPPGVRVAANGDSSAQTTGTQGIRIVGRPVRAPKVSTLKASDSDESSRTGARQVTTPDSDSWEWIIEATQSIAAAATSSAQASAAISPPSNMAADGGALPHGRLGVVAITMPGLLAADVQLVRVDAEVLRVIASPWVGSVSAELGVDVAANLQAGAIGLTVGSKAFTFAGYWSRWDMGTQGVALGLGLRF